MRLPEGLGTRPRAGEGWRSMEVLGIVVQWIHVLAAITWVGGGLYFDMVVLPTARGLPPEALQRFGQAITARSSRIFAGSAGIVMLMGLLRGTVFGPIKSFDVLFGTAYGITWLVALVVTIGLAFMGARVIGGRSERLFGDQALWVGGDGASLPPAVVAQVAALRQLALIELGGFLVVFTCMILMRFGY